MIVSWQMIDGYRSLMLLDDHRWFGNSLDTPMIWHVLILAVRCGSIMKGLTDHVLRISRTIQYDGSWTEGSRLIDWLIIPLRVVFIVLIVFLFWALWGALASSKTCSLLQVMCWKRGLQNGGNRVARNENDPPHAKQAPRKQIHLNQHPKANTRMM